MVLRWSSIVIVVVLAFSGCAATPTVIASEATLAVSPNMGRDEAIAKLAAETFLPIDKATCVIDEVFANTGVYNPNSLQAQAEVDQSVLVAGCTEVDNDFVMPERDENAEVIEVEELAVETGEIEVVERFELTEATMPAINPGGIATGAVQIDGKTIDYVTITPAGFKVGDFAPVFFALPPGGQDLTITRDVAAGVYMNQALTRGWVVVSPASPGGVWYDDDNTAVVPEFVRWMKAWVEMDGGKPHLGGMSNGGLSAFHIALQDPNQFRSLLVYPGLPESAADRNKLETLVNIPVRMWVGGDDPSWSEPMQTTAEELRLIGADVELTVLQGEPHVLQSITNGIAIFNELSSAQ